MSIKTTVGHVATRGGEPHDRPGGILVEEPTSFFAKGRGRGSLYVQVQVLDEAAGGRALADELALLIRQVYYGWRGSVTAGLQHAIGEANDRLFDENRNSLPGEQQTAGVSCVVLRDDDLFVAQAGPAAVYLAQEDEVTRFPERSPWLDEMPAADVDVAPLGERRDVHVDLFHAPVSAGDWFLLLDGDTARDLAPEAWAGLPDEPSLDDVLAGLEAAGRGESLSALAVKLGESQAQTEMARPPAPAGARAPRRAAGPSIVEQARQRLGHVELGERLRALGRGIARALAAVWAALLTLIQRMVPGQTEPQQATRRQTESMAKRTQDKRGKKGREAGRAQSDLVQRLLIGIAIAIPIIVGIVVVVIVVQRGQAQRAELEALWENANLNWEQAQAASDPVAIRAYLNEAEAYLEEYLERRPEDADAIELRGQIQARLDEINRVERINWLGELKLYPADADLTRVVVEGVHVFVMDRNGGKVYHHQLDEFQQSLRPDTLETVLVSKGQQVGDTLVADLVDMTWMPTGHGRQKAALVILESGGTLLEYDPTTRELVALDVAATDQWQFPKLVGSHSGRFYLLDPTANQIWRYEPTPNDYSAAPDTWLQSEVDLLGVVDMAVGDSIFLLYADGQLRKLSLGAPDAFDISDWDSPPRNPGALFTRPPDETQGVYVADRGNSRIVQCSKTGSFQRQFRLADANVEGGRDPLSDVTSLFVDEIDGHAFFLSGQALYMIILPEAAG